MDRFIVQAENGVYFQSRRLKSNMDRFIDDALKRVDEDFMLFKIQYG